jgi:outer membrane autotransporter protein
MKNWLNSQRINISTLFHQSAQVCSRGGWRAQIWNLICENMAKKLVVVSFFSIFGLPQVAHGVSPTEYWANPAPSGSWHTIQWSNFSDGTGGLVAWTEGNSAVFSATSAAQTGDYTVTLDFSATVQNITYTGGASGSTLTIAADTGAIVGASAEMAVNIDPGTTMIIEPPIIDGPLPHLTLNGGTLILAGTNNYSGGTTINTGTLQIGNGSTTGSIIGNVIDNANFAFNHSDDITFAGNISGTGSLTKNGSGTLTLTGTNTYGDGTTINTGTLQIGNGSTTGSIVGNVIDNANFAFNHSDDITFAGNISGTGSLTKNGPGTLTLTGTNTYGDGTTINTGTLQIGNGSTTGSIIGNVIDNANFAFNHSDDVTFAGNISGVGSLTQNGLGTLTLTGTNTYSGGTNVSGGTLSVDSNAELGSGGGITLIGGTLLTTGDGFTSARSILLQPAEGNDTLAAVEGTKATYTGPISGTADLTIGFASGINESGTVVLTNRTNSYEGGTTITAGATLSVDSDKELGSSTGGLRLQSGELLTTADGFSSARTVQLGKGFDILAAATGTTATYTGIFSGGILEAGDGVNGGTLVFTGNNVYTGGTNINPLATLVAGSDNALGTGPVTLFRGTLIIPTGVTIGNPVMFTGGGIVNNAGTLNNSITDAFSAPEIVINSGTINGNVLLGGAKDAVQLFTGSKISGKVELTGIQNGKANSTLILDGTGQQLFSLAVAGLVTNNGTLVKQGTGTWTIDRALAAPLGTEILSGILAVNVVLATPMVNIAQGGALQLNNGGDVGSFVDNGSLIFARSDTFTFNRTISGSGSVIQNGPGTTILSGANTYSGGTIIELGTLLVNNAQALGNGNVLVSGGVLGADPQPINVSGNYTQTAGGTLQLDIAGRATSQFDVLNVSGNAGLNGTLRLLNLGYQPQKGDKLQIVTTGGAVTGRFAQFQNPFTIGVGFNTVDLVYGRQSVTLEFLELNPPAPPVITTTDFASFAFTPNQSAAASLLDAVQLDPKATDLISFLNREPFANLPNDLQKISPDALTAFYEISFSNANIQRLNLEGRLDDLHSGSTGFSSNMKVNGATINDRPDPDGKSSKAVVEPVLQNAPENRWGVWVTGFGDFVNVDGDGNGEGYNFTTGGVSVGVDYRITDQLAIGVMGDYSHTWTSLQDGGNIDVNSGRGGLYATWYNHGIYLDAAAYAGHNSYNSSRSGLDGSANGNTGGTEWSTFLSGGYDFHFGPLTVGPIAALQYTYANVSGFSENGSLAPMQVQSDSQDSLRTDVGFRLFYQWQIGKILLEPSLKAAWEHEYLYSALPITAGFAGVPGPSATFSGPSEGHDSAIVSAGVSAQWTPALTLYVNYDGQLGRGNYSSNAVAGGVRISF